MKIQCCNHSGRCSYLNSSEKEGCIWTHSWIHILWISYHILHCEPTIPAFKSLFKPTKLPISRPNGDKARVKNLENSFPIILLPIIIVANHSSQPAPLHGSITTRYCSLHIANAYDKKVRIQHRMHPPCFNLRIRYTSFMYLGHRALGEREREREYDEWSLHISVNLPHPWAWRRNISWQPADLSSSRMLLVDGEWFQLSAPH